MEVRYIEVPGLGIVTEALYRQHGEDCCMRWLGMLTPDQAWALIKDLRRRAAQ